MAETNTHTKLIVREQLPRARDFAAEGKRRLAAREARVADLQRKGHDAQQSRKLLAIMRETTALQISHVKLLEWEVRADPGVE